MWSATNLTDFPVFLCVTLPTVKMSSLLRHKHREPHRLGPLESNRDTR